MAQRDEKATIFSASFTIESVIDVGTMSLVGIFIFLVLVHCKIEDKSSPDI